MMEIILNWMGVPIVNFHVNQNVITANLVFACPASLDGCLTYSQCVNHSVVI
jgi:hypothetical protein